MRYLIICLLLFFLHNNVIAQNVEGNELQNIFKEAEEKNMFSEYDSLIFFNSEGYWDEKTNIKGIGFKNEKCYKLIIKGSLRLKIKKVLRKGGCSSAKRMTKIDLVDFSQIKKIDNDSINAQNYSGSKISLSVSDGKTYFLIYINSSKHILFVKESYMPKFYQERNYTKDRAIFLKIYNWLNSFW